MTKTDITVRELVDKVQRGELTLPEMQRRYVWPATRVRDLLDSLYRGYLSGTILVWETDEEIETRELAVKASKTPTTSQKLLLLDGQQRVTSLSAILGGEPVHVRGRKRPIDILFNLEHPEGAPVEILELEDEQLTTDLEEVEDEESADRDIQEELKKRAFVVAIRGSKRAGMPKVNRDHLFVYKFRLPPLNLQKEFSQYIFDASLIQKKQSVGLEKLSKVFESVLSETAG